MVKLQTLQTTDSSNWTLLGLCCRPQCSPQQWSATWSSGQFEADVELCALHNFEVYDKITQCKVAVTGLLESGRAPLSRRRWSWRKNFIQVWFTERFKVRKYQKTNTVLILISLGINCWQENAEYYQPYPSAEKYFIQVTSCINVPKPLIFHHWCLN